jgi:hypothetical protein
VTKPPVVAVATLVLSLLHIPPEGVETYVVVPPLHKLDKPPESADGCGLIVTVVLVAHVLVPVYVSTTNAGEVLLTLYTKAEPVVLLTLRLVALLLLQVPPVGVEVKDTVEPEHTGKETTADGRALTVAVVVT